LGVASDHVRIIPNWADGTTVVHIDRATNALRAEWDLGDAFVVGYSGNLGRAHEIETLLAAIAIVEKAGAVETTTPVGNASRRPPVLWLFVGGGALFDPLKAEVARRGLTSVRFKPYQPRECLGESLSAADVHLVSLRPELEGLIVPSKFYGICAAGRPTIFVGDKDGEIARLIARYQCGRTVAMGDGAGLARTILDLAADPGLCRQMGQRARQAFDAEFDKSIAVTRWERLLLEISGPAAAEAHRQVEETASAQSVRNAR
jgi:glycosyltransferase involved in cell wall biosynthesis